MYTGDYRNLRSFDEQPIIRNDMTIMVYEPFLYGRPGADDVPYDAVNGESHIVQDRK